jgi:2'-hydroxyisoflavone reductase
MRLLVIGGTVFLGRHVVEIALAREHAVTIFHRGLHGAADPRAEELLGDRTRDLSALGGREWDAVIDTCGFQPEEVALTAGALADRAGHYGFVSSGSAYRDWPDTPVSEDSPTFDSGSRDYGPGKAAAERAAEAAMPGRVLVARAGVIVGPHENIGRLPWWLGRLAEGGEVVAPGPPEAELQLIDARDLAGWMLDLAERGVGGTFNATAPIGQATFGELLALIADATGSGARPHHLSDAALESAGVQPWTELPLWAPWPGTWRIATDRARAAGLRARPLSETVRDVAAWLRTDPVLPDWRAEHRPAPMTREREAELLALV